jgi:hypothetical protein
MAFDLRKGANGFEEKGKRVSPIIHDKSLTRWQKEKGSVQLFMINH